jgi:ABC-type transporter Mla subunit MlaD
VVVGLRVFKGIRIPKKFRFQITSTGLLGDRFVEVLPQSDFNPAQFDPTDPSQIWGDGDRIAGEGGGGLSDLTKQGGDVMEKLQVELDNIQKITNTLNKELLSQQNLKNVEATLANLKTASASFDTAAQNATQVMANAKETMTTVNSAASDLRGAVGDARKTLDGAKTLLRKATEGNGLLPALLSDRELAENFRSLITNLRRSGVLFYKDAAAHAKETPPPRGIRNR